MAVFLLRKQARVHPQTSPRECVRTALRTPQRAASDCHEKTQIDPEKLDNRYPMSYLYHV